MDGAQALTGRPFITGVSGPVAVGKSTFAAELARRASRSNVVTAVVATDGFLLPNAELDARGLTMRKGFPESFDTPRMAQFLADAICRQIGRALDATAEGARTTLQNQFGLPLVQRYLGPYRTPRR